MTKIEISYSAVPRGLVGTRPKKIRLNEPCRFFSKDPGTLIVEFLNDSPLKTGKEIKGDVDFVAEKQGSFRFKCKFTSTDGREIVLGDPDDPNSKGDGGELEVGT